MKRITVALFILFSGYAFGKSNSHTKQETIAFWKGVSAGIWLSSTQTEKIMGWKQTKPDSDWHDEWGNCFDEFVNKKGLLKITPVIDQNIKPIFPKEPQ